MNDFFPIRGIDHLEFYVGNAKQAAQFYETHFGFTTTAYRGLETGSRAIASYVLQQGEIRWVFSTALHPDHPIAQSVLTHGDTIAVLALEVPDAINAYKETLDRGAVGAMPPMEVDDGYGLWRYAAVHGYGETLIQFVDRSDYRGIFAPGFVPYSGSASQGVGLQAIDHVVGNVELGEMDQWVKFFAQTMGFQLLMHFDDQAISTQYSALMSKVMKDGTGKIKFPINEPAAGPHKSQVQEYLDYHHGPGIQHVALATDNIIETVAQLRQRGVKFLPVPAAYYDALASRVGDIDESIAHLAELGILVDRDGEGYLLQIFTQPVQDRPTLFFEVIERHGAQGFGEGNFKALFEAIERAQGGRGNL